MNISKTIFILLITLLITDKSSAQNHLPCNAQSIMGFTPLFQHGDYGYYLSTEAMTWENAALACEAQGGELATIHNQQLNTFFRNAIGKQSAYIGDNDLENEGTFSWHSGESTFYDKLAGTNTPLGDFVSINFWNADWTLNRASTALPFLMQVYCPVVLEDLPDLTTSGIILPIEASSTESISIEFSLNNLTPNDAANSFQITFYLSLDNILSNNDILVGSQEAGFIPGDYSSNIACEECVGIPWNIAPGNYYLIVQTDNSDYIQEFDEENNISFSENIISIDGAAFIDPCDVSLGYFSTTHCLNFDENGGITIVGETVNGNLVENQYSELGVLQSSTSFTGTFSTEIDNNTIVQKDFSENIISTIPIDPNLVALYTTGENSFGQVAQNMNGEFYVIGRVVGPTPAPFEPWNQASTESTVDQFYIHHLDDTGSEIDNELIVEKTYFNRDIYFLEVDGVFEYKGIIPHSDGKVSVYITQFQTWVGSSNPSGSESHEYIVDYALQTSTETELGGPTTFNAITRHSIESNICTYDKFQSVKYFGTWSPHGSSNSTVTSYLDYGVTPTSMYKKTYQYYGNTYGQGDEEFHLIIPNSDGSEFQILRSESITELFYPGFFTTQEMALDSTIIEHDSIYLPGPPNDIFNLSDGTYNIIGGEGSMYLSNSACLEPMPDNTSVQRKDTAKHTSFEIKNVFPNPTDQILYFKIENELTQIVDCTIVNGQGSVVAQKRFDVENGKITKSINVDQLTSGIYFIRFSNEVSEITHRFVKL